MTDKEALELVKKAIPEDRYISSQILLDDNYWFGIVPQKYKGQSSTNDINEAYYINTNDKDTVHKVTLFDFFNAMDDAKEIKKIPI